MWTLKKLRNSQYIVFFWKFLHLFFTKQSFSHIKFNFNHNDFIYSATYLKTDFIYSVHRISTNYSSNLLPKSGNKVTILGGNYFQSSHSFMICLFNDDAVISEKVDIFSRGERSEIGQPWEYPRDYRR